MSWKYILVDKKVVPCDDVLKWAKWMEDENKENNRCVAFTQINKHITISTAFLGLDFNMGVSSVPSLFESLVFEDGLGSGEMVRYSTYEEAEKGHKRLVKKYKNE